jgi:hypothetical protein
MSQVSGYRGEIVDEPKLPTRSFSGQINSPGFSQFPGQGPMMSGALPVGSVPPPMDAHVSSQFPGQDPAQYTQSFKPGISHSDSFGAAADYYQDTGQYNP